jgi:hypothetical protein
VFQIRFPTPTNFLGFFLIIKLSFPCWKSFQVYFLFWNICHAGPTCRLLSICTRPARQSVVCTWQPICVWSSTCHRVAGKNCRSGRPPVSEAPLSERAATAVRVRHTTASCLHRSSVPLPVTVTSRRRRSR